MDIDKEKIFAVIKENTLRILPDARPEDIEIDDAAIAHVHRFRADGRGQQKQDEARGSADHDFQINEEAGEAIQSGWQRRSNPFLFFWNEQGARFLAVTAA